MAKKWNGSEWVNVSDDVGAPPATETPPAAGNGPSSNEPPAPQPPDAPKRESIIDEPKKNDDQIQL